MLDINEISTDIINSFHTNKKINNDLSKLSYNNILRILNLLLHSIHNGEFNLINNGVTILTKKNFKMEDYYILFDFIVDNFLKNDTIVDKALYNNVLNLLLTKLTMLNKGQYLLEKLENIILNDINNLDIVKYITIASQDGTFITFKFWSSKKHLKELDNKIMGNLLINSIANSDDRIYKFLLDYITNINKFFFQKNNIIKEIIASLAKSRVPAKYILKRIKLLSMKTNLNKYFIFMIQMFKDTKIIIELHKYYYVLPHTFSSLIQIYNIFFYNNYMDYSEIILSLLKSEQEKLMLNIIMVIQTNDSIENYNFDKLLLEKIIIDNYNSILGFINWELFLNTNNEYIDFILKTLTKNNLIHKYLNEYDLFTENIHLLFFTRFYMIKNKKNKNMKNVIIVNKILHKFRILAKRIKKSKVINHNIKMYDILREIKTFTPNNKKNILKCGSIQYQYESQRFTNLPPRHLLPGEIHSYENFIIREKADGILIDNLPIDIYPNNELINNYNIKAEYIEDLDLYLVFDIDIPNTTIIERYNILRQAHEITKNTCLNKVTNLKEYIELFDNERLLLMKFLNSNDSIKWYPKFSCLVNNSDMNDQLITEIIFESDICKKLNSSKPYMCDGFIITPIDGSREIKIKPLSMMTIDILFSGNKWLDRDNNDLSDIVISKINVKNGKIYRCKPILGNDIKFIVDCYRYDKKKPNPHIVVNSIINILKYDWNLDIAKPVAKYYYDKPKKLISKSLILIIKSHQNMLLEQIEKLNPTMNSKWLDLGCGKGKLIPFIKKYNPKLYYGLDIDVSCLVKCLKYHDENQEVYIFNKCDLANDWNRTNGQWVSIDNKYKFDYIVANFSLMHFFTDLFWEQLDLIVLSGTKFIFNLVSEYELNEWKESDSFLRIENDKVIYKFEWIHDSVKTEEFISQEKLLNQLEKHNWKVNSRYTDSKFQLSNFYTWWIVEKI